MELSALRKITISAETRGVDDATDKLRQLGQAHAAVAQSSAALTEAVARMERQFNSVLRTQQDFARAQNQIAANDNGRSISEFGEKAFETANKLKFLAAAAYALSPALRAATNEGLAAAAAALGAMVPTAASVGRAILSVLAPALAFFSRLTIPIMSVVVAWKALNYVIELGSGLLDKYGNYQRSLIENVDQNLSKVTRFQSDSISLQQVQYATELGDRLAVAHRKIDEFLKVQIDVTDFALKLQNVWVKIVEAIAQAAGYVQKIVDLMGKIPNIGNIATAAASAIPGVGLPFAALRAVNAAAPKLPEPTEADLLKDAYARLAAGMGSTTNFAVRFGQAINDLANPQKKAAEEAKKVTGEFDRLEASLGRQAAAQEADGAAVGTSVGEHARLRAEFRLLEAAQQDIAKNGGNIDAYADRIKKLADRFGEAAQASALLQLQSRIKLDRDTLLFSDTDKQIAQQLVPIYGDVVTAMNSAEAAQMRWNAQFRDFANIASNAFAGFARDIAAGVRPLQAIGNQLTSIANTLLEMASKDLIRQALGGLTGKDTGQGLGKMIGDLVGVSTGLGSLLGIGASSAAGVGGLMFAKAKPAGKTAANDNRKEQARDHDRDQYHRAA